MTDSVIQQIENFLGKAKDLLSFLNERKAHIEKGMFGSDGRIRSNISLEVAQRNVEIEGIQKRIKNLEAALQHAKDDFPRRESERKKAADLEIKAQEKDQKAASQVEQLRQVESEAISLRSQAAEAQKLANATANELAFRALESANV